MGSTTRDSKPQARKPHPNRATQKTLSYTKAICFTLLMKPTFVLLAIFVTPQPILRVEKYVDSVSTCSENRQKCEASHVPNMMPA
ncbi:MAG: hypothetical protein AABY88_13015 [Pseudomonadota bacterium]